MRKSLLEFLDYKSLLGRTHIVLLFHKPQKKPGKNVLIKIQSSAFLNNFSCYLIRTSIEEDRSVYFYLGSYFQRCVYCVEMGSRWQKRPVPTCILVKQTVSW